MKNIFIFTILLSFYSLSSNAFIKIKVVDCTGFDESSAVSDVEAFYSLASHQIMSLVITELSGEAVQISKPTWNVANALFTLESEGTLLTIDGTQGETDSGWPATLIHNGETTSNFFCTVRTREN